MGLAEAAAFTWLMRPGVIAETGVRVEIRGVGTLSGSGAAAAIVFGVFTDVVGVEAGTAVVEGAGGNVGAGEGVDVGTGVGAIGTEAAVAAGVGVGVGTGAAAMGTCAVEVDGIYGYVGRYATVDCQ